MNFIVKRKVLISMLFIASTLLGYISYKQLKMEMLPNAELPMLFVQVSSAIEVTPEYMEQKVIIPVESAVASLENIEMIESRASRKNGMVLISYEKKTNLKFAYLKLDEQIAALRGTLPEGFFIQVIKVDLDMNTNVLMNLQIQGTGGEDRIRNFVDQKIKPTLVNIEGVASINIFGGNEKTVDILLDKAACEAHNISISRIRNVLNRNMNQRQYGGTIEEQGKRHFIYLNAEYDDILQIENLIVGRGQNPVRLKDVAKMHYGTKEEETISRINGKEAITVSVVNDAQANLIELSKTLRKEFKMLNDKYRPLGIEILVQDDSAEMLEDNINQIINLALFGGILAVFILWIFLRNIRLVVIIALAMPVSVYTAFNLFYGFDVSVNSLTLVGIALAIGMLLDTSVVVLENIYRLRTLGNSATDSVIQGTREVWRSVVAATLTTITVFVPFIFSSSPLLKLLGKHIGTSIISTLLISLLVSLLLIPMLVHVVLRSRRKSGGEVYQKVSIDNRGVRFYLFLLKAALRNPAPTVTGVIVLFFATILVSMAVSVNSLSELDTRQVSLYVTMPTGSTLEHTNETIIRLEDAVADVKELENIIAQVKQEEATLTLSLKEDFQKIDKRSYGDIQTEVLKLTKDLTNADISLTPTSPSGNRGRSGFGGGGARSFNRMMGIGENEDYIQIKGQDFDLMVEVAELLQSYLEDMYTMDRVRLSVRENQPEVHIEFNDRLMTDYGISQSNIANELGSFQNEVESGISFRQGTEEYQIMIKYDEVLHKDSREDKTMDDLTTLGIPDESDVTLHELQSFSKVFYSKGMREISRTNQEKQIELQFRYTDEVYDSKELKDLSRNEIEEIIKNAGIPGGIAVELVPEESQLDKFKYLILLAFVLVYIILASVFESFVTPFVLLFAIPFAAIGSFFFLTITGNSLFNNANTMTGFLILLGVVVNNGIILLDYVAVLRKNGFRKTRAILHAGLSRIRPILITTVTTCVAMLPLAMGNIEYVKAIGPPFAITVIGGLSVSTLLTLVYIPMLYNALEEALNWIQSLSLFVKYSLALLQLVGLVLVILVFHVTFIAKIALVLVIIIGLPAAYWFILNSLRRAKERIIPKSDSIKIEVSNLVKVYGRKSKLRRDFQAGNIRSFKAEKNKKLSCDAVIWQLPLIGFLGYFTWYYLQSSVWQIVSAIGLYFLLLFILDSYNRNRRQKRFYILKKVIRNIGPAVILSLHYLSWRNLALAIIIAASWYIGLAIYHISKQLKSDSFDISTIQKTSRWFYKLIRRIPGIGGEKEQFKALKGVSLEIGTGMFGLLGPNGAGKSTMIRIICGILEQSYGKIWINGIDTMEKREELQGLIGYLPQEFGMYENLTAEGYLEYQAMLKGFYDPANRSKRIREVLKSVHMWEKRNNKIGSFSGGMKQRIGIAQVLLHMPKILVVDEPTAGLDPRERIRFRNMLVELSRNRIVIFSTHIIEDISSSCNTMAVINKGKVEFNGTPKEMTRLAKGKVWKFNVPADNFKEITSKMRVVHHMKDQEQIRVRVISDSQPFESAEPEQPLLEDAYLWLLQSKNGEIQKNE